MLMSAQKQDTCNFTVHSDESDYELDESDTKAASPRIVGFYIEEQRNNAAMPNTSSDANSRRPQSHFNPGYGLAEWNRIRKRERNKRNREKKKQKRKMQLLHPGSIYPSTSELYNDQRLYNHESDENEPVSVLKTEEIIKPFSDEDMRRNGFDVPHIDEDEYTNPFSDYDGYRTESSPNNGNSGETVRNFAGHFVPVRKESENFNTPMVKHVENSRKCSTSVSSCSMSMDETTSSSDAQIAFTAKKVSTMNMPTASVSETAIDMNTPVSPVSENLEEGINDENMLASPMSESSDDTDGTQITMNLSSISKSTEEEKVDDRVVTINDPSVYQGLVDRLLVNRESSRKTNAFYSRENQNNIETGSATEYTSGWPRTNGQDIASLLQKTGLFLGSGQPHHDSDADYELFSGSILNRNGFVNRRGTPLPDVPQNHMNLGSNARSSNTIYDHGVSKKVIKAEYRQWEWVQASSEFSSKENSNEKYPMVKEMVEEESISSSDLHDDDLMSGSSISSSEEDLCAGSMQGNEPIRYVQQEHHAGASDSFDSEDISASDSNFSSVEDEQNKHVEHYPDLHASSSNSELIDFSSFLTQPRSDEITDLREQRDPLHSESFFSSQKNEHKLENDASTRSARTVNMDSTSMLTGFTTASKKQIYVSEDAIKKMAKRLDQDSERAADDNAVGVSMDVFDEENIFNDVRMRENAQVKVSVLTEDCVFSDGEPSNKSKEESNENGKRTRPGDTVDGESVIRNDRSHITGAKAEDTRNGRDLNGKQSKNRSDTGKQIVKELEASAINGMEKKVLEVSDETNKNRSISRIGGRIDICNSKFCVDGAQKENEPVVGANAKDKNKQNRIVKHASKDEIRVKMDDIAPINNDIITKNAPMRMYGKPVKGHTTLEIQKNRKIEEIYAKIAKKYKNQRKEWVDVQFKWAYLSCFKSNTLERDIADRMEKRRISEYSILRRIVEGDDVCFKLMCLMIVRTGSMLELYDGFYSLLFRADKAIQGRVVAQKLKIGDKIYVFNAELLTHEKDILAIDGPAFQMHSNSVMRVRDDKKLGYTKCASFLIKFTNVDKTGGLVPAIEFSIIKIVEDKVLIQCQGLKRAVDMTKLEEEMEYMKVLAVKHGVKEEFKLKRYCKLLVKDLHSCREGIFTWWNIREEIRIGDKIRAISTAIVNDTVGLHFNTINRSYVAKICWSFKRGTVSLVTGKILKDGGVRNRMYDLIVIGGGSGGIAAARETAKLGKRVLLIENAYLGGTCVNLGCVPKKITYNMTNIIEHMLLARSYGVYPSYEVDYGLFKECRDSAIRRLNIIYESMLGSNNVEVINGYARVIAAGKVEVNGRVHDGTHILLASGSKPKTLEIKGKEFVKYSDDFFYLKSIPKKTVIIGSGYISLEIAFMLALLGSEVSIILRGKRFLSHFDELFDSVVKEQLEKHRIRAYYEESVLEVCEEDRRSNNEQKETGEDNRGCQGTSTECGNGQNRTEQKENDVPPNEAYKNKIKQIKVVDVSKDRTNNKVRFGIHGEEINVKDKEDVLEIHKDEVRVEFEDERPRDSTYKVVLNNAVINNADFVMCAIGRDCDLSYVQVPINTHNSYAVVDEKFMTSVEGVYAVGDLIGPNHMLTPFAIFCARKLVRSLFEHEPIPADVYEFVPSVVFTHPPCASVGLSEQAAVARYGSVEVYETRFNNLIYALSDNKTSTVFKAIVHGGRVVGLHLFGNGVDEIVQGFAVGMKKGLSLDDLSNCVCVHPTAAEEVVTIGRVSPRRADK